MLIRTNLPNFKKDTKTNTLINTNVNLIEATKTARRLYKERKNTEDRINNLEYRIAQLERLIRQ
jgi:vacuolar-type H+-ATPase subunit D/Vma8